MRSGGGSVLRVILKHLSHCAMSTHLLQTASRRSLNGDANVKVGGGGTSTVTVRLHERKRCHNHIVLEWYIEV